MPDSFFSRKHPSHIATILGCILLLVVVGIPLGFYAYQQYQEWVGQ